LNCRSSLFYNIKKVGLGLNHLNLGYELCYVPVFTQTYDTQFCSRRCRITKIGIGTGGLLLWYLFYEGTKEFLPELYPRDFICFGNSAELAIISRVTAMVYRQEKVSYWGLATCTEPNSRGNVDLRFLVSVDSSLALRHSEPTISTNSSKLIVNSVICDNYCKDTLEIIAGYDFVYIHCIALKQVPVIAELQRAKRASEAPWVRKIGSPWSWENLVMTSAYDRASERPYRLGGSGRGVLRYSSRSPIWETLSLAVFCLEKSEKHSFLFAMSANDRSGWSNVSR